LIFHRYKKLSHPKGPYDKRQITTTRETLINDTDTLKRDAGQIVEDVKNHAYAHVDAAKDTVNNAFNQTRDYVKSVLCMSPLSRFSSVFLLVLFRRK